MDLGLANLVTLKRHLLAPDLRSRTTWDDVIADVGKGVAAHFERYCNRLWKRTAGETDIFTGDRQTWILRRYPVESISALDLRDDLNTGWLTMGTVASVVANWSAASGLVDFGEQQADAQALIRITYTGGYWYDEAETGDTTPPAGSTAVPAHLKEAWLLQCRKVWEVIDPLGGGLAKGGANVQLVGLSMAGLELIPQVKQMLQPERRYAIT